MGCGCHKKKLSTVENLGVLLQGYGDYGAGGPVVQGLGSLMGMGDIDPNAVLWPSRNVLAAETQKLQDRTKQLASDWFNGGGGSVSQGQLGRWNSYVTDLKAWDWGPDWLAHVIDATWRDELLVFQNRFNGFLSEWQNAGVYTTAPAFTFEAAPPSTLEKLADKATKPLADTANIVKWVTIAGGAAVVGLLFFATQQAGGIGRALAPVIARNPRRRRRVRR